MRISGFTMQSLSATPPFSTRAWRLPLVSAIDCLLLLSAFSQCLAYSLNDVANSHAFDRYSASHHFRIQIPGIASPSNLIPSSQNSLVSSPNSSLISTTTPNSASLPTKFYTSPQFAFDQGSLPSKRVAKGNPFTYDPSWPWAKSGTGRCSKVVVRIPVTSAADFKFRLRYPPTRTVHLALLNSFEIEEGLVIGPRYACTIISAPRRGIWIRSQVGSSPVLAITNTSNVAVVNISMSLNFKKAQGCPQADPEGGNTYVCPTVLVWRSFGVQIAQGAVVGRIQLVRSMYCSVDSMTATSPINSFSTNPGVIRVITSGSGPPLLRSGISISNNNVYGVDDVIVMHFGAIGVDVYNNYVHDYGFAGIRCGDYISHQGDCMLSYIFRNRVVNPIEHGSDDTGAIYYNTHWINPGNLATCNYVYGGDRCYYLDNHSSGITILGGACIQQRDGGIKVNGGKWNLARYVIVKSIGGMPAWAQCLFNKDFNCLTSVGKHWIFMYKTFYNTSIINQYNPWYKTICTETKVDNKFPCNPPHNPPYTVTGNCSGMATNNFADIVMVNSTTAPGYRYCTEYPVMPTLNTWVYINKSSPAWYQFVNYKGNNLALRLTSPLYKLRPSFRSCSSQAAGPQKVMHTQYWNRFNIPEPFGFKTVLNMTTLQYNDFLNNPSNGG